MAEQEARLQQLRAQQERWMRERDSALERERVEEELQAEQQQQHPQNGWGAGTSKAGKAAMARADGLVPVEVMDKLTARLADRLRTEIKEEMEKENGKNGGWGVGRDRAESGAELDSKLAREIETHTCPICFELMVAPAHSPTLLFPCGHTFCSLCLEKHQHQQGKKRCPYCRANIESSALNRSLQQLIQKYVAARTSPPPEEEARSPLGRGAAPGDPPRRSFEELPETLPPSLATGLASRKGRRASTDTEFYLRRQQELEMRCRILSNEMADSLEKQESYLADKEASEKVLHHLEGELGRVSAALRKLQEEKAFLDDQVTAQQAKVGTLSSKCTESQERLKLVQRTLGPLQAEMEKVDLILAGLAGRQYQM